MYELTLTGYVLCTLYSIHNTTDALFRDHKQNKSV